MKSADPQAALRTVALLQEQLWISLHGFVYSLQEKKRIPTPAYQGLRVLYV